MRYFIFAGIVGIVSVIVYRRVSNNQVFDLGVCWGGDIECH